MHFTKNISYKLKRLVPALGLAGAAAMMPGCDKSDEPIMPQTPPSTTPIEVELYFSVDNFNEIAGDLLYRGPEPFYSPSAKLKDYALQPEISNIYLVPRGTWYQYGTYDIQALYFHTLNPLLKYSPKIRGRGNFVFTPGAASSRDSLWLVEHGWTVNQQMAQNIKSKQR